MDPKQDFSRFQDFLVEQKIVKNHFVSDKNSHTTQRIDSVPRPSQVFTKAWLYFRMRGTGDSECSL